jgi:GNAT superfamily N-acetyltransferase
MIHVRTMIAADLPLLAQLVGRAGWNQTEADCRRFLDLEPAGCFVAEFNGRPAGTTTTCRLGHVGWIGMVLVEETLRRRGIGTRLVESAVSHLEDQRTPTIRLDATELGRPMYERLGFVAEYELERYRGRAGGSNRSERIEPLKEDRLTDITEFDGRVTGTDRARLIERLFADQPRCAGMLRQDSEFAGYAMYRPGRRATQIGPAAASSQQAGHVLLDWALGQSSQQTVFIDIPCDNPDATKWAASRGLSRQRGFVRMIRGARVADRPEHIWATSGPEKG